MSRADIVVSYGGMRKRPISDVIKTQDATNTNPGCQKNRLSPVAFSSLATPSVQTNPNTTVKKNGGKEAQSSGISEGGRSNTIETGCS
jgi:hypothetical protein